MPSSLHRRLGRAELRLSFLYHMVESIGIRERIDRQNAYQAAHPDDELVAQVTELANAYLHSLYVERLAAQGRTEQGGPFIAYPDGWRSSEQIAADFDAARVALDEAVDTWHAATH